MSSKRTATFTVNIGANITDLLQKSEQAKNAISNIFNVNNLGQSLAGDFNKLGKIMTRIQNTASGPIRSEWGVENLIADFKRAGQEIDEIRAKIASFQNSGILKEKVSILGKEQVQLVEDLETLLGQINSKESARLATLKQIDKLEKTINEKTNQKEYKEAQQKLKEANEKVEELTKLQNELKDKKKPSYTRTDTDRSLSEIAKKGLNKENIQNLFGGFFSSAGKVKLDKIFGNDWEKIQDKIFNKDGTFSMAKDGLLMKRFKQELTNEGVVDDDEVKAAVKAFQELVKQKNAFLKVDNAQKDVSDQLKKAQANATAAKTEFDKLNEEIKPLQAQLKNLYIKRDKNAEIVSPESVENLKKLAEQAGYSEEQVDELMQKLGDNPDAQKFNQAIDEINENLGTQAVEAYNKATVAADEYDQALRKTEQDTNAQVEAERKLNEQQARVDAITNRIKMFTGFYGIMNLVRRSINSAISTIKELDEQMTKMAVVTGPSISDYWKQLPQYTKRANALGAAIKEVYEADTLYYQQGLKTNQVIAVSNETMKMARIAALDAAEATDRMTSAMRGFNMEINETSAERVNDVYSQLAAITASDVNEISVAMTKTASIAHSAGMEFETTAAFLSQIIETTRESADTAGTALKTIIARFEELKKSPNEIGEIDGEAVDANKIETALRTVGIALRDTQGQFRDLDDVFLELSGKWDSLDKNTQRYIATIAAGSRQQSRFIAMMQNYAHTVDLVAKANGSAGASQKQFEKTLDSMKTKLNALRNAWDTFTMGILDSDFLKGLVGIGTTFMDVLNKIGKAADAMNVSLLGSVTRVGLLIAGLRTLGKIGKTAIPYLLGKQLPEGTGSGFLKILNGISNAQITKAGITSGAKKGATGILSGLSKIKGAATNGADNSAAFTLPGLGKVFEQGTERAKVLNSSLVKTSLLLVAIVAAIKSIQFAVSTVSGALKVINGELISSEELLENYTERLDGSKKKLEEIRNSRDAFKELKSNFDGLVVGTAQWRDELAKVNEQVIQLIQKYPTLAAYVSKSSLGELQIDEKGFKELEKLQNKEIYFNQRKVFNAQSRVYDTEMAQKNTSALKNIQAAVDSDSLGQKIFDKINSLSTEELRNLQITENYSPLAKELNTSTESIHNAIQAIYANKTQTEANTKALQLQEENLKQNKPEEIASQKFINDYIDKFASGYAEAARKDADQYYTYEKSSAIKDIIKFYGGDTDLIKGKGDSDILAYVYGLQKGITDFSEAVDKFGDSAGYWSARGDLEDQLFKEYGRDKAEKEAYADNSIAKQNEELLKKNPILYNLLMNPNKVTKEQYNKLKLEDIKSANIDEKTKQDLINKYFSAFASREDRRKAYNEYIKKNVSKDQYEALQKATGEDYWRIADGLTAMYGLQDYSDWSRNQERTVKNDFESMFGDPVREGLLYFSKELQDSLSQIFDGRTFLSNDTEAKLINTFKQIFTYSGRKGVEEFKSSIDTILADNSLTEGQKEEITSLFSSIDVHDIKALEDIRKTLSEKYPDITWIDELIDKTIELGKAVKNVDLSSLAENIESFFKRVRTAVDKNFNYTFTEEEKKTYIATGAFKEEDFKKSIFGDYYFDGTEQAFEEALKSVIASGALDNAIAQGELYQKNLGNTDVSSLDISRSTVTLYTSPSSSQTATRLSQDAQIAYDTIRSGIEKGILDKSEDWLNNLFFGKDIQTAEIINTLQILSQYAEKLETNKELNNAFGTRQTQLEYAGVAGYNVIENGAINTEKYIALFDMLRHSEDIDPQRINQLSDMFEEFKEAVESSDTKKIEKLTKDINEFSAELSGAVATSNAEKKIKSVFNTAKTGIEKLDEGVVKSKEDIAFLEQSLSEAGMQIGTLNEDNAQMYADLMNAFSQGSYEAYDAMVQMITLSTGSTLSQLEEIQKGVTAQNQYLADYLEKMGMGWQANGKFNMFSRSFIESLADDGGKDKDKKVNPWENPYDWLWNITEQINKTLYQRERLERKYKLAVDDTVKSAEDLYDISKKELDNLQEQARLQSLKGQKATEEAQLLLSHYKEYAKYVSMNPLTGQVQVAYEDLDKKNWSQEQGSAFEGFVSRLTELASEIKDSNKTLEEIEDEVKEIQLRGKQELIDLQNRVKDALVTEREREIETLEQVNDAITNQQSKLLEAMRDEIDETRRIRENTDKQEEIEKKRQRLAYLQRDTSGANQTEILGLQEEIEKDTLSYGDALIDQSLQKMQEDNELAAEKRQEQIDIANFQLARWQESGAIWDTVGPLLENYFNSSSADLENLIFSSENWQALSELERQDLEEELYKNGKLAELFNKKELYGAANGTLTEVKKYSNTLQSKLNSSGVLGNKILDNGEHLKVTLKDFNPKESADSANNKLSNINGLLSSIYQWLRSVKLTESAGTLQKTTQSLKAIPTVANQQTADIILDEYTSNVKEFVSAATGTTSLKEEAAKQAVADALEQQDKDLIEYLKKEYHTNDLKVVAKALLHNAGYPGFKTGGLNTTTGPAWLDGTPSKPEYVLNADQTRAFFSLVNGVDTITKSGGATGGGDNYFNVEVNVDEISNDYDVDRAIERVKQAILEDSQYRNVNFISGLTY